MKTMDRDEFGRVPIQEVQVKAYTIPTEMPEADGTLKWNSTTLVLVRLAGGGETGIGYSYTTAATARFIDDILKPVIKGEPAADIPGCREKMIRAIRNQGRGGISAMAVSAVDLALWDLKAKLLAIPLTDLLGRVRQSVPVYGSGGFTSCTIDQLQEQLAKWAADGIKNVKIKIGSDREKTLRRISAAREAIGPEIGLFVDANSAFNRKEALHFMQEADRFGISWMEQPLAPEDLDGLRMLRNRAPAGWEIADGEYGYQPSDFRRFLQAEAIDVMMADATRCGGISGILQVSALCEAWRVPLSSHCAPLLHIAAGCAIPAMRHIEYFHDHVRIEKLLFEGNPVPVEGKLSPNRQKPGLGVEFLEDVARRYQVYPNKSG